MSQSELKKLAEQNKALMERLEKLENSQAKPVEVQELRGKPKKGYKFIKAYVMEGNDLVRKIIEVPKEHVGSPVSGTLNASAPSKSDQIGVGNPMGSKPLGKNDVEVTGI